ncbi:putative neutral sphingomyelinase [Neocloeon triangulifer]|uniref:putative neutral sphingomyelinase n=1 Tax=Neocloeon triangulifer TaxID=2078957 RepID=UPI00286F673D|nr:putative neutral sphingomyelinase [Neocloeon triangulifer]
MAFNLSIFTLNCWGIPFLSKDVPVRMNAIANFLAQCSFDVICLQEVWSNSDYELIKNRVQDNLPYSHYFHSGVIGSGLCIFSRYPIIDSLFHQWAVNGYVHKIQHGDWFGGKGVGLCRILVGEHHVNVYTAHLHAEYDRENDEYLAHRVVQAFDTAQFIKLSSSPHEISVVAGDLNTEPYDNAFHIIKHVPGLHDCQDYKSEELMTNEAKSNNYRLMTAASPTAPGKRIDFILFKPPQGVSVDVRDFGYALPGKVEGTDLSYSDHEALLAVLSINFSMKSDDNKVSEVQTLRVNALEKAINVCEEALHDLKQKQLRLTYGVVFTLLALLATHILLPKLLPDGPLATGFNVVLHLSLLLTEVFLLFMITIWHRMEVNGINAGKLGMQLTLDKLINA